VKAAILISLLALAANTAGAEPFFDFYGYSFVEGPVFEVGTVATICMRFDGIQPDPPMPLDLGDREYTVLVDELEITDVQQTGPMLLVTYDDGTLEIFEDPAQNSSWPANPPNGLVPGNFQDGALILSGYFTSCILVYNTALEVGTVEGYVTFQAGTRLGELTNPVDWTFFGGVTAREEAGVPPGYDAAWDPQLLHPGPPVATQPTAWGAIKQLYR
jgi:hypothetical protein